MNLPRIRLEAREPNVNHFAPLDGLTGQSHDPAAPNNLPGNKRVTAGKTLELTLHRTDEGLFLDGEFKVATVKEAGQHSVRVATVGIRLMEKITLGKPIVVPFVLSETPEQHGRFELVVTEAVPSRLVRQLHPVR